MTSREGRFGRLSCALIVGVVACTPSKPAEIPEDELIPPEEPIAPVASPAQPERGVIQPIESGEADDREPVGGRVIDLASYLRTPAEYRDYTVQGVARVAEAVSDRAFWLTDGTHTVFAVLREDTPGDRGRVALSPGQLIRFEGRARTSDALEGMSLPLTPQTMSAVQERAGFISVHGDDIAILAEAPGLSTEPSSDP